MTAQEVLTTYWKEGTVPVNVLLIATRMNIFVMAEPSQSGVSGHYRPNSYNGCPVITYNPEESIVRQRFTIAHELGHHVLGHGERNRELPKDTHNTFLSYVDNAIEREANTFAVNLLMPEKYVRAVVEVKGIYKIKELARIFGVSSPAMKWRLEELGYVFRERR